jgi:hypothetical protein
VLSFSSSRRTWDSPTPYPQASVPPPFGSGGRGTLAGEGGGGRGPVPTKGRILWYSIYIYVLVGAACPKFDMVWLNLSPIPVGRRGVISSFQ